MLSVEECHLVTSPVSLLKGHSCQPMSLSSVAPLIPPRTAAALKHGELSRESYGQPGTSDHITAGCTALQKEPGSYSKPWDPPLTWLTPNEVIPHSNAVPLL